MKSKRKDPWIPHHDGKKRCKVCNGTGKVISFAMYWNEAAKHYQCVECGGKGYK